MSLRSRCILTAVLFAAVVTAGIYIFHRDPTGNIFIPCGFRLVTGLHCPGCGGTRAVWHLLHGNILSCLRHNILLLPLGAMILTLIWRPEALDRKMMPFVLPGVLVTFFILRNIQWGPFVYLAP